MSVRSIERAIPAGTRLLLDSTSLVAYLNRAERVSNVSASIVDDFVASARNPAIISTVSVAEVLVRPLRAEPPDDYAHVLDFLTGFPNLRCVSVDLHVAQEAASLRATYGLSTPDALIVATGIVAQVGCIITNDERWVRKLQPLARRISVVYLNRYA
jgi:uncharacterized protein